MAVLIHVFSPNQRDRLDLPEPSCYSSPFRKRLVREVTTLSTIPNTPQAPVKGAVATISQVGNKALSKQYNAKRLNFDDDDETYQIVALKPIASIARSSSVKNGNSSSSSSSSSSSTPTVHNVLFTPPLSKNLQLTPHTATPVKVQRAIERGGRLMMWAYALDNPSPSTILVKWDGGSCQRSYELDPEKISDHLIAHAELGYQLSCLLLRTYSEIPYADRVKVSKAGGATFQLGHAIHQDYNSAHASCVPRLGDTFFDHLLLELCEIDLEAFLQKRAFFKDALSYVFAEAEIEKKLKEIELILQETPISPGALVLQKSTPLLQAIIDLKAELETDSTPIDAYIKSHSEFLANLEREVKSCDNPLNKIDRARLRAQALTNPNYRGIIFSSSEDPYNFAKDSLEIIKRKLEKEPTTDLMNVKTDIENRLILWRQEQKRLKNIAQQIEVELPKGHSIEENQREILDKITATQEALKNPLSQSSSNLKRKLLYKVNDLLERASHLSLSLSPFNLPARAHDVGNRLESLKQELLSFQGMLSNVTTLKSLPLVGGLCEEVAQEINKTRRFRLEKVAVPYFSSPEEFYYPLGRSLETGAIVKKSLHENSIVGLSSPLFQLLNTTHDLPSYVNRLVDGNIERILQDELFSLINNEKELPFEEKCVRFRDYSIRTCKQVKERFDKGVVLFLQIHEMYKQIHAKAEALHSIPNGVNNPILCQPLIKEIYDLHAAYVKELEKLQDLESGGFISCLARDLDSLIRTDNKLSSVFEAAKHGITELEKSLGNRLTLIREQLSSLIALAEIEAKQFGAESEFNAHIANLQDNPQSEELRACLESWFSKHHSPKMGDRFNAIQTEYWRLKFKCIGLLCIAKKASGDQSSKFDECLAKAGFTFDRVQKQDRSLSNEQLMSALGYWLAEFPDSELSKTKLKPLFDPELSEFFSRQVVRELCDFYKLPIQGDLDELKRQFFIALNRDPTALLFIPLKRASFATELQKVCSIKDKPKELEGWEKAERDMRYAIKTFEYQIDALTDAAVPDQFSEGDSKEFLSPLLSPRYKICYNPNNREIGHSPQTIMISEK